jgi:hydrogenase-4 component B
VCGLLLAVIAAAALAIRASGFAVRRADTWGCGRIRQTPRMEYTSSAFAEPLRRIFAELYRPSEDLSITAHPDSPYFVRSITYTSRVAPWIEKALYDPITAAARSTATSVRRLQAGSVHLYLLYVSAALVAALASAWWFK